MSRDLTSGMQSAATADLVRPFYLVDLNFTSGSIYLWSGHGDLIWNSNTYLGAGDLLSISSFEEKTDLGAVGASLTLTGVKTSLVQKARDEDYQGRSVVIRLGAFDATASIINDPVTIFSGFMDVMTISEGADYSTITVAIENKLLQLEKTKERRYTDGDQKLDFPNDYSFEFVAKIQEKEIVWGRKSSSVGGGGSSYGLGIDPMAF